MSIQGSNRFLDTKFETFFKLFSKQLLYFFFQTQGYQIGDHWKNARRKLFSWCAADIQARLNKIWPKRNINFTYKALFVTLKKKTLKTFPQYPEFFSIRSWTSERYHFLLTCFLFSIFSIKIDKIDRLITEIDKIDNHKNSILIDKL